MRSFLFLIIISSFLFAQNNPVGNNAPKGSPLLKVTIKNGKITNTENVTPQNLPAGNDRNRKIIGQTIEVAAEDAGLNKNTNIQKEKINRTTTGVDLEISDAWINASRSPVISFNLRFKNNGTDMIPGGTIAIDAYLSLDNILDASDYFTWGGLLANNIEPGFRYLFLSYQEANVTGFPDGTYNLIFKIDATDVFTETDENNNIFRAWNSNVTIGTFTNDYDFEITSIVLTQNTNPINFEYTIRNNGTYAADPVTTIWSNIYLSTDTKINTSDYLMASYIDNVPVFGGEVTRQVVGLNLSGLPDNYYYLGVLTDADFAVVETNESNNFSYTTPQISIATNNTDLYLFDLTVSDGEGPEISYNVRVLCQSSAGNVIANLSTYLSTDAEITTSDMLLNNWQNATFIPGETNTFTISNYNVSAFPNGTYYLGAIVDPDNTVLEMIEFNNSRASNSPEVIINNPPNNFDLSVYGLEIYDATGPDIQYHYEVSNMGSSGTIPANSFYINEYLSDDLNITTSDYLINSSMNPFDMTPGYNWNASPTITISGVPDGNYYLGIIVDPTEVLADVNRGNNTIALSTPQIQVGGGTAGNFDLLVYGLEIYDAIGPEIQCSFNCVNIGGSGTIPINSFYTGIYLSEDLTVTESDYLIYSFINEFQVESSATWSSAPIITFSGVPDGNYYLGVILDHTNAISDVDRANNTISLSTPQIQVSSGTTDNYDLSVSAITVSDPVLPEIHYDFTITNNGTAGTIPADGFWVGEFLSSDANITADDFNIAEWLNPIEFAPGGNYYYNSIRSVTGVPDGQYYYGVILDLYNSIPETEEGNNSNFCVSPLIDINSGALCSDVVLLNGWNIISIPILTTDMSIASIFPDAVSNAFGYNNGYITATTFEQGKGYWLKYPNPATINVCGSKFAGDVPITQGWNIVSIYENNYSVENINTVPAGIITSSFYGYNNGYVAATTLESGKGYWVKANQDGTIVYPALSKEQTENIPAISISKEWSRIELTDASGRTGVLYISENEFNLDKYELPPLPPDGIFDFRFTTDRLVEGLNSGTKEIRISSAVYPVTIKVVGTELKITDAFGGLIVNDLVKSGESILINNRSIELLNIEKLTTPNDFILYQNYPNPFNPVTIIKFSIPVDSKVKIAVYNLLGQEEKEILNQNVSAGSSEIEFDGSDLPSGFYIYSISAGSLTGDKVYRDLKSMLLLK